MAFPVAPVGFNAGNQPFQVQRSLRFLSSNQQYLSRTPSISGSLTTWTWSCWVKRNSLFSDQLFLGWNAGNNYHTVGLYESTNTAKNTINFQLFKIIYLKILGNFNYIIVYLICWFLTYLFYRYYFLFILFIFYNFFLLILKNILI